MLLQTRFIAFIVLIHAVALGAAFWIFRKNALYFVGSEVVIFISLLICWSLYLDLVQPLRRLMTGLAAIRERDFNVKFLPTGKAETDVLIGVYNAMIDQLRHERIQQEAQHFFLEKLIFTAPSGILILDFEGNIADFNPKAAKILNLPPKKAGEKSLNLMAMKGENALLNVIFELKNGDAKTMNLGNAKTFRCSKAQFVDRGFARFFVVIEELTAEILAAEKAAYGKVIRLMAHEVNNSIGAVNSILDTTIQLNEARPTTNDALKIAFERNEHLNQFMRNFADLVRLPPPNFARVDVVDLVKKTAQLMSYKVAQNDIIFRFELENAPLSIKADFGQMEQVLINIVKNAVESIENQGLITFRTIAEPPQLCIEDNGKGIPKTVENELFSPFFTTKTYGQGVGLMLVRDVLRSHGFSFSLTTFDTTDGKKTVFKIAFS